MQWAALLLLTIGVVAVEMSGTKSDAPLGTRRHHLGMGATAAFASALLSSCAGVYFEAVVKKQDANAPSLWVRNVQLCVFSVPLAACGVAYQWRNIQAAGGPLSGFDGYTNLLVLLNAAGGLVVAVVVKYGDNVLKNFTTSCSVILGAFPYGAAKRKTQTQICFAGWLARTFFLFFAWSHRKWFLQFRHPCVPATGTIISVFLFDFQLTLQFVWGAALVIFSAYIYGRAVAKASHVTTNPSIGLGSLCCGFFDCCCRQADTTDKTMEMLLRGKSTHVDSGDADFCDELTFLPRFPELNVEKVRQQEGVPPVKICSDDKMCATEYRWQSV